MLAVSGLPVSALAADKPVVEDVLNKNIAPEKDTTSAQNGTSAQVPSGNVFAKDSNPLTQPQRVVDGLKNLFRYYTADAYRNAEFFADTDHNGDASFQEVMSAI